MYDITSKSGGDFLADEEIDAALTGEGDLPAILAKAGSGAGLTHREALALMLSEEPTAKLSEKLRREYFAGSVNICAPIGADESTASLKLRADGIASVGHRNLLLSLTDCADGLGADAVRALLSVKSGKRHIRRVDVSLSGETNIEALRGLCEAGAATIIFPAESPASDLAKEAGCADVGLAYCFASENYLRGLALLLMHAGHLTALGGYGARIFVLKRSSELPEDIFARICQVVRIAQPQSAIMIGGDGSEASLSDSATTLLLDPAQESPDRAVNRLIRRGILPSFCSACKSCGRTGAEFFSCVREGQLHNFCYLNALLSLKEFLADFAAQDTRIVGTDLILKELYNIGNADVRAIIVRTLKDIRNGKRDFSI